MKILASFYNEQSSYNGTVSMLGSRVCPDCINKFHSIGESHDNCDRCHGDGLLTNKIPFNSNLMECAIAPSLMEEQGWKLGDVVKIIHTILNPCSGIGGSFNRNIVVRITDFMKDHNCRCGHVKENHKCKTRNEDDCEYCIVECNILDECVPNCKCTQYQQRCIDLTEGAFKQLAPLSVGLIEAEIEVLK